MFSLTFLSRLVRARSPQTASAPPAPSDVRLPWAIFAAPLLDEWTTGFLVVALPQLRTQVGLSYTQIGLLFTFGAITALIYDPLLSLLSDRAAKWPPMLLGMLALAACYVFAGFAGSFALLAVAFALLWPAVSTALDLAQMVLIDLAPDQSQRTMARWTLLSGVGDLLAPLSVTLFLALSLGWTALCLLAAGLWLAAALLNWRVRPEQPQQEATHAAPPAGESGREDEDADGGEERVPMLLALRRALRNPLLLRWVLVATVASMLDEIFLGFAGLYLADSLHVTTNVVSLALLANLIGSMFGLLLLDRVFSHLPGSRLLPWYALLALVGMLSFLLAPGVWAATGALFLVGLGASGWYPVAMAAAYRTHPGRSGLVRAVYSLGSPFEVALPGVVGFLSGRFGLLVGLGFLGLAPLLVLLVMPHASRPEPPPHVHAGL